MLLKGSLGMNCVLLGVVLSSIVISRNDPLENELLLVGSISQAPIFDSSSEPADTDPKTKRGIDPERGPDREGTLAVSKRYLRNVLVFSNRGQLRDEVISYLGLSEAEAIALRRDLKDVVNDVVEIQKSMVRESDSGSGVEFLIEPLPEHLPKFTAQLEGVFAKYTKPEIARFLTDAAAEGYTFLGDLRRARRVSFERGDGGDGHVRMRIQTEEAPNSGGLFRTGVVFRPLYGPPSSDRNQEKLAPYYDILRLADGRLDP